MRTRSNALLITVFTLTACSWFDDLEERTLDSGLASDGGDQRPTPDGSMDGGREAGAGGNGGDSGTGGSGGSEPTEPPDGGMDGSDAIVDEAVDSGDRLPDAELPDAYYPPLDALLTWQPEPRRVAVVDDEAAEFGQQTRVWLIARGEDDDRGRLVSYRLDEMRRGAWLDTGVTGITSAPETLTHWGSSTSFQRVFFIRDGELNMWIHDTVENEADTDTEDGGAEDPLEALPIEPGYTLTGGDLGSVMIMDSGEHVMVVIAPAEKEGVRGYYCMYELRFESSASSCRCSEEAILADDTELVAQNYGHRVFAFARGAQDELRVITRELDGAIAHRALDMPEGARLGASLAMYIGDIYVADILDLMVVMQDGIAWHASIGVALDGPPRWTELPELPTGIKLQTGPAALTALEIEIFEHDVLTRSVVVYGLGEDGALYEIEIDKYNVPNPWRDAWYEVPAAAREQRVLAIGGVARSAGGLGGNFYTFAHSVNVIGGARGRVLSDTVVAFASSASRDHMRYRATEPIQVASAGAEISVASGADDGIAATALRSTDHPQIVLSATVDSASSWHTVPFTPPPFEGKEDSAVAAADPAVAYGKGVLHFVDREWPADADCATAAREHEQRIVYRRGRDVRAIADLRDGSDDLYVVASEGHYSASTLVVTENAAGPTAHVLFNDVDDRVAHYWRLQPDSLEADAMPLPSDKLPMGKLQLVAGGVSSVYAVGLADGLLRVCDLTNAETNKIDRIPCAWIGLDALILDERSIPFGKPHAQPQGACPQVGGQYYKCLRDDKPYSIAGSARVANKLFIAYAADDGGASSIFLTWGDGSEVDGWNTVLVSDRLPRDRRDFFDAEITVDDRGEVIVTYAAIERASENTRVDVYAAQAYVVPREATEELDIVVTHIDSWDAADLQFDCVTRRWSLGDYRDPDTIGGRSLHAHRSAVDGAPPVQMTRWLNNKLDLAP